MTTFLNDINVPSSPVFSVDNQLCTAKFYGSDLVSMGIEFEADIFCEMVEFRNSPVENKQHFNQHNLFMCKYLNLRGSSFTDFNVDCLLSLEFIDVRCTKILLLNLKNCSRLRLVVADLSQIIIVNDYVEVVSFTLPAISQDGVYDTSSSYKTESVNFGEEYEDSDLTDLQIYFNANVIKTKQIDTRNLVSCK